MKEKVKPAKLLLGEVQNLFTFFAGSTSRWKLLKEKCCIGLKCQSATRWSSRANAVLSLWNQLGSVIEVLTEMCESDELSSDVLSTAHGRLRAIESFRFIMGLCVWKNLLGQIDKCNEFLQLKGCDLHSASKRLHALVDWLTEFNETGFDQCIQEAKELAGVLQIDISTGFEDTRRGRGRNRKFMDEDQAAIVTAQTNTERFRKDFFTAVMERLISELNSRFQEVRDVSEKFGFLWGQNLRQNLTEKLQATYNLSEAYPNDLDYSSFATEVKSLPSVVQAFTQKEANMCEIGPLELLNLLYKNGLDETYKNSSIALRIFLSLPTSVASNERSFSKLRRIKDYTRSTMSQERLSGLSIISIEKETAQQVDIHGVIEKFINKCGRRFNRFK